MEKKQTLQKYSPEVKERAIRLVFEHVGDYPSRKAAIISVASKIGCGASTLHSWIVQSEMYPKGHLRAEAERIKALEREKRELRQANEILRKASAYFAQAELDRRTKS